MFNGYSDQTVDMFWNIRLINEREWFRGQKQQFQASVMEPTKALANELLDRLTEEYPKLGLNLHISRVYRDARRLFGRGPLNDHIWFSFQTAVENREQAPALWFEVGCEGVSYGLGYWMKAADAARYRRLIDAKPEQLLKFVEAFGKQTQFVLDGAEYARPKGHADDALNHWYNKRWVSLETARQYDAVCYSPELAQVVMDGFRSIMPYYQLLEKVYQMAD